LCCPLDIVVAKKITQPSNPELAIGAVTADGAVLWAEDAIQGRQAGKSDTSSLSIALQQAREKAIAQLKQLTPGRPSCMVAGKIAILVDDGIATGMTMAVAAQAVRSQHPAQIWLCAPVAPAELMRRLEAWGDRVILLATPSPFYSVSRFYQQFPQVETEAALVCLQRQNDTAV
ncbi:MAG: phosphoribosyltransferase family protein, partial [Leptolyngbyaceae cyanobacterium bins.59]|nr:phosphoribosyltransferase family protein [Leptolyngbyaceae cyanobacterium bins.59]